MTAFAGFGDGKMGEGLMAAPVGGLAAKSRITADDVLLLRGQVFRDGVVTPG